MTSVLLVPILAALPAVAGAGPLRLAPAHDLVASGSSAPPAEPGFGFELLPPEKKPEARKAARLESALRTRRTLLTLHQGLGLAMAAGLIGTVVTGQLNYSDRFAGLPATGRYELWHDGFEAGTVLTFAAAGLLALLAPEPVKKKSEGIDTIKIHEYSMLAATVGFAAEIVLGILTVSREGYLNQPTLATTHLVIGYTTAGFVATGVTALFFR